MKKYIPARGRYFADHGWLKTYWLFSFAEYFDPVNVEFGNLRVFNDDIIEPHSGFPLHPHANMEIVTIVLSGEITHEDSMGNREVVSAGEVQRMSAGTGVHHSEFNRGDEPLALYQIWFRPDSISEKGYAQKTYELQKNELVPLVSKDGRDGSLAMNADAIVYRMFLESGKIVPFDLAEGRGLFVYMRSGKITLAGESLSTGDQLRIDEPGFFDFVAHADSDFILIDVKSHA